jgi:hypothetical protein
MIPVSQANPPIEGFRHPRTYSAEIVLEILAFERTTNQSGRLKLKRGFDT